MSDNMRRDVQTCNGDLGAQDGCLSVRPVALWYSLSEVTFSKLVRWSCQASLRAYRSPSWKRWPPLSTLISTFIAGIPELVGDGENGWLVPPGDVDALVGALKPRHMSPPLSDCARLPFQRADLTALSFATNTFDFVVSWGVIMHIPDIEKALAELARVLKPGGLLVLCENNVDSLDVVVRERLINSIKRAIGRNTPKMRDASSSIGQVYPGCNASESFGL
jgi:SAM-dependent methyltransferase